MTMSKCPGCGGLFEDIEGPTHRYLESSPGCWAGYGEVLTKEYTDAGYYSIHRLTVDSYAVQHPGQPSPQTIQSVAIHLISLCLVLERGLGLQRATQAMQITAKDKNRFVWLRPPESLGAITVADVRTATNVEQHQKLVRAWAASAWNAWSAHHATIGAWLPTEF